jgi:hypothetical protein
MTYAELVQKIRDYTEVGSEVLTSTIVNGFIRDAEFKIFREADADYAREYATSHLQLIINIYYFLIHHSLQDQQLQEEL